MSIHVNTNTMIPLFRYLSVFLLVLALCAPQLLSASGKPGVDAPRIDSVMNEDPGIELWNIVRQRGQQSQGITQVKGTDSNILINENGDLWATYRSEMLIKYAMMAVAAVVVVLLVFYLLRGPLKIEGGLSGNKILRFRTFERISHWTMAIVFLFLGITGLILLFGRPLLIPLLGNEGFSLIASPSLEGHNLFGPIFLVSLILMVISLVKRNLYAKGDLTWLLKAGGAFGDSHVSCGFFNMGEKIWYWIVILIGFVVSISGLVLLNGDLIQSRLIMEAGHVIHTLGAMLLIIGSLGHMYIGSIGMEGAYEGMRNGYVDVNWAEAHHDLWAKECREKGLILTAEEFARRQGMALSGGNAAPMATKET